MKKAVVAASVLLFVGAPLIWYVGRPAYRHHQELRAVERAKRLAAGEDFRNAALSARQALLLNPRNLEACQIMAAMAEAAGAPQRLEWRQRIAEIAPTVENELKLAAAAIQLEDPPCAIAERSLHKVSKSAGNRPVFHVLSAQLALRLNKPLEAETHFLEASRLEPTNQLHRLNVAVLRLSSTNPIAADEGWTAMESLATQSNLAPAALHSLISASLASKNLAAAEKYSSRLLAGFSTSLDDRLRHLGILREEKSEQFEPYLARVKQEVFTNAGAVQALSAWMINHALAAEAFTWLTNCPQNLKEQQPVRQAIADAYAAGHDWAGLELFLQPEKWGEADFLRLGLLARAAFEQNHLAAGEAQWRLALRQAGNQLGPLVALLRLATDPVPDRAREDLLWRVAEKFPREEWSFRELDRLYLAAGNTRGLNRLYSVMSLSRPGDARVKNNLAATSLLLHLNVPRAHELARENYQRKPSEPIVASTYAYSLYLQGHTVEGLEALEKLKPEALELPTLALYYGLLLSADGQKTKAARYLALAAAARLLPEEQALLSLAQHP